MNNFFYKYKIIITISIIRYITYSILFTFNHTPPSTAQKFAFIAYVIGVFVFSFNVTLKFFITDTSPTLVCIRPNLAPAKNSHHVINKNTLRS